MSIETGMLSLPRSEYDALPDRVNFSTLKWMSKSPEHYLWHLLNRSEDTDAMLRGRAVHMNVFEPERFRSTFVVWEDRRAGKAWEQFEKKHAADGREVLTEGMHSLAVDIAGKARTNPMLSKYLTGGKGEQTVLWTHEVPAMGALPAYSVRCKGRLDFISNLGPIVDLKTTEDASPEGFYWSARKYKYFAQGAWYRRGLQLALGEALPRPYIIAAVESKPPYVCQVYRLTDDELEFGREQYRGWLDRLNLCRSESRYPSYSDGELELTAPEGADDPTGLGLVING